MKSPILNLDELRTAAQNYGLPVKIPATHALAAYNPDIYICKINGHFIAKRKDSSVMDYNAGPHYIITGHPLLNSDVVIVGGLFDEVDSKLQDLVPLLPLDRLLSITPEEAKERVEFIPAEVKKVAEKFGVVVDHVLPPYRGNEIHLCKIQGSWFLKRERSPSEDFAGETVLIANDPLRGFEDVASKEPLDSEYGYKSKTAGVPNKIPVITVGEARTYLSQAITTGTVTAAQASAERTTPLGRV